MKLISLTVENYRSITAARKIPISNLVTLVGPNNEGKSNILNALVLGVSALAENYQRKSFLYKYNKKRHLRNAVYDWEADFPLELQKINPDGSCHITLEFELHDSDIEAFRSQFSLKVETSIVVSIQFGKTNIPKFELRNMGDDSASLAKNATAVARFISHRVDIQYIPAVRNVASAQDIVNDLVAKELSKIEEATRYRQALRDIAECQEPVINQLSESITATIKQFMPAIKQAKIVVEEQDRSIALRRAFTLFVDDGAETPLQAKGDGVQSLTALALMRHAAQYKSSTQDSIIALEEPESHLHPDAIRALKGVLEDLSGNNQVVITTHNPIFANKINVLNNIIVSNNRAYPASSVKEIRDVLGVRVDDNLTSAELILIVEGEEDKIFFDAIFRLQGYGVDYAYKDGRLGIDVLRGAGNLAHRVRMHTEAVSRVHAFLDNDRAGKDAFEKAKRAGLMLDSQVNFAAVGGKTESELEDLYKEEVYADIIRQETGLDWIKTGPDKNAKWADRLRNLLRRAGKPHDDTAVFAIKLRVAAAAKELGLDSIHESKNLPIMSLLGSLKQSLDVS
ncbi:ATP-dependent nuclease [Methylocystis sp.]|uniref:ATP-dependent nuclease n=1 Tax=Methylocystis sp. TaxID=1911079 RepID=UPI003DA3C96D